MNTTMVAPTAKEFKSEQFTPPKYRYTDFVHTRALTDDVLRHNAHIALEAGLLPWGIRTMQFGIVGDVPQVFELRDQDGTKLLGVGLWM